jgi:Fe2+ or Zn2+ uptake regulation protein
MTAADVINSLKTKGHRITKGRKAVVESIFFSKKPLSVPEILLSTEAMGVLLNKTTIYRELSFLSRLNFVKKVNIVEGVTHWESSTLPHHHHLVCTSCKDVIDVECGGLESDVKELTNNYSKNTGFQKVDYTLEFKGICDSCS